MNISFIENERAALVGDYLVITDLHIGYESALRERGYSVPKMINRFIKTLKKLKKKTGASNLLILGDVKHKVPKIDIEEKYDIPSFFKTLSKEFEKIVIVKGNHDGYLEKMIHVTNVEIVKEYSLNDIGFIHGHSYPSEEIMSKKILFIGHTHPAFKVKDELRITHKYPCWILGKFNEKKIKKEYEKVNIERVVVVPAFNPLFVGYTELVGPFAKAVTKKEVLLLDLTKVT